MNIICKIVTAIQNARALQRINLALSRAATTSTLRNIDPRLPASWEFCGFSQNGEDGIIDYLCSQIKAPNRYFVEIGAADGLENNTAWLAIAKKYCGMMIEGDPVLAKRLQKTIPGLNLGVECENWFVSEENVNEILNRLPFSDPDLFSIDIDGNDLYIVKAFLSRGLRPKIIAVEYNSAFGPDRAITIPYQSDFDYQQAHASGLYYGVSITAWRELLKHYNYHFVTVDTNGVNAFFISPECFDSQFVEGIKPLKFAENFFQRKKFKGSWENQFALISHMNFSEAV